MQVEITKLMRAGIVRTSTSPWSSPTLLVPKPGTTGGHRLVVDYRRLNAAVPQPTIIPSIKSIIEFLGDFSYVTEPQWTWCTGTTGCLWTQHQSLSQRSQP